MARPNSRISQAVADLRAAHGATLDQFAHRLGVSLTTAWKWESIRPSKKSLQRLQGIAELHGLTDIARVFQDARHVLSNGKEKPKNGRGDR